jgi:hypothetical protein
MKDGTGATVYFYDGGMRPGPEGFSYEQVLAQMKQAKRDIFKAQSMGSWRSAELIAEHPLVDEGEVLGFISLFELETPDGEKVNSLIWITSSETQFIKIRLSFPKDVGPIFADAILALTRWLFSVAPNRCFKVH